MSLAFDIPYAELSKLLLTKMKELRKTAWNSRSVFEPVIYELGGSKYVEATPNDGQIDITLEEFVDTQADPNKCYILLVGTHNRPRSHMVCVRDGKIWDTWDSRNEIVDGYYIVDVANRKAFTDIQDHLKDLTLEYIYPVFEKEVQKYMDKKDWDGEYSFQGRRKNYLVEVTISLELYPTESISKTRKYTTQINCVFEPTMTEEDAINYIQKTGKQRMYDRLYAINEQEKKLQESMEISKAYGDTIKSPMLNYMSPRERKFANSLPGWVQPLLYDVRIDQPGQYHDSYRVDIYKLPGDTSHKSTTLTFEGYDASQIREELDRYKRNYEVEGVDYYWEY